MKFLAAGMAVALLSIGLNASPASADPRYPTCSSIWKTGKFVTKRYQGCRGGGTIYVGVYIKCENGKRLYTGPNDRGWVLAPGRVKFGGEKAYAMDYDKCLDLEAKP